MYFILKYCFVRFILRSYSKKMTFKALALDCSPLKSHSSILVHPPIENICLSPKRKVVFLKTEDGKSPCIISALVFFLGSVLTPTHTWATLSAQGFETLPRTLIECNLFSGSHHANAWCTLKLLKLVTVPVKTSAPYHGSPTNTLINPPFPSAGKEQTEMLGPLLFMHT